MAEPMANLNLWHYLGWFTFYTLASIAVIYGIFLYLKKNPRGLMLLGQPSAKAKEILEIESMLPLEGRKNLYVVRSGEERFLIATSLENTQFLSRLENTATPEKPEKLQKQERTETRKTTTEDMHVWSN